jgi:protease I
MNRKTWVFLAVAIILLLVFIPLFSMGCNGGSEEKPADTKQEEKEKDQVEEGETAEEGTVLLIISPTDFQDQEYTVTRKVLEDAGYEVAVASATMDTAVGADDTQVQPDITLQDVDVNNYVAVAFIGGGGCTIYYNDPDALVIAEDAYDKSLTVGAICLAPGILAIAGVLQGKEATVDPGGITLLEENGATFIDQDVVVDGKIVTACGPPASQAFGEALVENIQM